MKLRNILILCLLSISTHSWSESKWLSYGNGMINLNNVSSITPGKTTHKEMYEGTVLYENTVLRDIYGVLIPSDRCNSGYMWTYREWVNSSKKDKEYLGLYSNEVIEHESSKLKGSKLSLIEGYSNITLYDTFKNWYFFKNPLTENQINNVPEIKLSISEQEKLLESPDVVNTINERLYSLLPVTKDQYEDWLMKEDVPNKVIEEIYNLNNHYLSNTDPMYQNSIKFDDFELWISGTSCDLNLVSSESESKKLIQDTLSKIGTFINSDKGYMELF